MTTHRLARPFPFNIFEQCFNFLQGLPRRSQRRSHLAKTHTALLQFPLLRGTLPLNGALNGALDGRLIDPLRPTRSLKVFDLPLQLGDPPARLSEPANFVFRFLWQVCKLAQYSANGARRRRRRKQMTLAGARVRGANLVRAESYHPGLTQRWRVSRTSARLERAT